MLLLGLPGCGPCSPFSRHAWALSMGGGCSTAQHPGEGREPDATPDPGGKPARR